MTDGACPLPCRREWREGATGGMSRDLEEKVSGCWSWWTDIFAVASLFPTSVLRSFCFCCDTHSRLPGRSFLPVLSYYIVYGVLYFDSTKENGRSEFQRSGLEGRSPWQAKWAPAYQSGFFGGQRISRRTRAGASGAWHVTGESPTNSAEAASRRTLNNLIMGCF